MRLHRVWAASIIMLGVGVVTVGCGAPADPVVEAPVGRWTRTAPDTMGSVEFGPDGRFALTDSSGGSVIGRWESAQPGSVRVTLTGSDILRERMEPIDPEQFDVEARIEGGLLRLTVDDETEVYRRAAGGD